MKPSSMLWPLRSSILLIFVVSLISCKSTQDTSSSQPSVEKIILDRLGPNTLLAYNDNKQYVLGKDNPEPDGSGRHVVRYLVLRVADAKTMAEGTVVNGYVKWINDTTIETFNSPGKQQWNEDLSRYKKIINLEEPSLK